MAIIEIKVPGTSDNESAQILKALNLLLRVGEANMQAIADFGAAQKEFHQRMDVAMQKISDSMSQGGALAEESQRILNELHSEMETRVGALEELANRQAPVPPVV
jgi:uncharacterized membrane protein YccC